MTNPIYSVEGIPDCYQLVEALCRERAYAGYQGFCIGNALKYIYRYTRKGAGPRQWGADLKKAVEYLTDLYEWELDRELDYKGEKNGT